MVMKSREGYLRCAYFFHALRQSTGLTLKQIEVRALNQYVGLTPPSSDTLLAYFEFKRDLSVDSFGAVKFPFLLALALEFPGSEENYFHPCFDIIFGVKESISERKFRQQLFDVNVIKEVQKQEELEREREIERLAKLKRKPKGAKFDELPSLAARMRAHNAAQKRKRGRPPSEGARAVWAADELKFAHHCMLRLPDEIRKKLFAECPEMGSSHWARRYRSVEEEIADVLKHPTIDGLGAMLSMFREAGQIGDRRRFLIQRQTILTLLPKLSNLPKAKAFSAVLTNSVQEFCATESPRLYKLSTAIESGLPATWKDRQVLSHFYEIGYAPRLGDQPGTVEFDCILKPELLNRVRRSSGHGHDC